MASIHLQGSLDTTLGDVDVGGIITWTHLTTTGDTIESTKVELIVPPDGSYSIDVNYGQIRFDYTTDNVKRHIATVVVNADSTATTIPELLNAAVPPTNSQLLIFQDLLADTVAAKDLAEAAAAQITTTELILSIAIFAPDQVVTTSGFLTTGDSGTGKWKQNGVTAQPANQSPAQLGFGLLNDGNGNQWKLIYGDKLFIEMLGATTADVDNQLIIQTGLNQLNADGGGVLSGLAKSYRCDDNLIGFTKVSMDFEKDFQLDFTNKPTFDGEYFVKYLGAVSATTALTVATVRKDKTITVADSSAFAVGRMIEITEPGNSGDWVDSSIGVVIGELQIVTEIVSATEIGISDSILEEEPYAIGSQVNLIDSIDDVTINNLGLLGKGRQAAGTADFGINIIYGKDVAVTNCDVDKVDTHSIVFTSCYNYRAEGNSVIDDVKGVNGTVNYGIIPTSACNHGWLEDNYILNSRHGIVTSHTSSALPVKYPGIVRDLKVLKNPIMNTWHAAIVTHNDCEYLDVYRNSLTNCQIGIELRDRNQSATHNTVTNCVQAFTLASRPRNISVDDNNVTGCENVLLASSIDVDWAMKYIKVRRNEADNCEGGISLINGVTTETQLGLNISDNELSNIDGAGGSSGLIKVDGNFSGKINGNDISEYENAAAIWLGANMLQTQVNNNKMTNSSSRALFVDGAVGAGVLFQWNHYVGTNGVTGTSNLNTFANNFDGGTTPI